MCQARPAERKRIAVVGAGASGMAAAWSLARFPENYDVTVIEPSSECGGVACTLDYEGARINYGVQGGSPAAHSNTVELMKVFGFEVGPTKLDVSFGAGEYNWKNYESKPLQQRLASETRRFGTVLKWVSRLEFVTIFVSIDFLLRVLRFSADFRHRMVYPLVALFFGTGNQTPVRRIRSFAAALSGTLTASTVLSLAHRNLHPHVCRQSLRLLWQGSSSTSRSPSSITTQNASSGRLLRTSCAAPRLTLVVSEQKSTAS